MCRVISTLLVLGLTLAPFVAANTKTASDISINRETESPYSRRSPDDTHVIRHQGERPDDRKRAYYYVSQQGSRIEYETPAQIQADTAIDHSFDEVDEKLQQFVPPDKAVPDVYDPDEIADEIAKQSIVRTSVDTERQDRLYASPSNESELSSKNSAWIAHGTIAVLCFGLLIPASISSALFRDFIPEYWIYIHVFFNVAAFILVATTVGVAFASMHSLGDKNEGHLKELHHVVGLGLLMLVSFQTANGFLRPPREFVTEDEEDCTPGAIHTSDWERSKLTPRTLWHLVHRVSGIIIFALGTWQVQSGMAIYARKYNGADWGSVYLGYMGWLVFVIAAAKLWMIYKETKREGKNDWNAEDELFDTDTHLYEDD